MDPLRELHPISSDLNSICQDRCSLHYHWGWTAIMRSPPQHPQRERERDQIMKHKPGQRMCRGNSFAPLVLRRTHKSYY